MNYKIISKVLGLYLYAYSIVLAIPLAIAFYYQFFSVPADHPQPHISLSFLMTIAVAIVLASGFYSYGRKVKERIYRREGLFIVVIIWLLTPAISALPFWFSSTLTNPISAYFEAVSGLTTTGATALTAKNFDRSSGKEIPITMTVHGEKNIIYSYYGTVEPVRDPVTHKILYEGVEAVSKALLFWRAFMQWIGGVGIVVLFVAVLPALGVGGKLLFYTEMPGPIKESLTPRIKETAVELWKIYFLLTFAQIVLLKLTNGKMEWLDAVTTSFATISTGGFCIRNQGIAYYNSAVSEWIIIIFMLFGSINFALLYYVMKGKIYRLYEPEFICFIIIVLSICSFASWNLIGTPKYPLTGSESSVLNVHEAIRYGSFQVISAMSTTGFAIANYDKWPYIVQTIMLIAIYIGGMSGSTTGGIKIMRQYIASKLTWNKIQSLYQPKSIHIFKIGDKEVDNNSLIMVLCFIIVMVVVSVCGVFLYIMDGIDPETALGLVAAMINCSGQSFRAAGPTESCAFLSNFGYVLSALLMLLGRLEFFAMFALLAPSFWKKNK
jgi:trk system potassium uptake protein